MSCVVCWLVLFFFYSFCCRLCGNFSCAHRRRRWINWTRNEISINRTTSPRLTSPLTFACTSSAICSNGCLDLHNVNYTEQWGDGSLLQFAKWTAFYNTFSRSKCQCKFVEQNQMFDFLSNIWHFRRHQMHSVCIFLSFLASIRSLR